MSGDAVRRRTEARRADRRAGLRRSARAEERQPVLDRLAGASRRFQVHALVELDVSEAQRADRARRAARVVDRIRHREPRPGGRAHPEVNARKAGNRILTFDRVDIGATVERHWEGRSRPRRRDRSATPTACPAPRSPRCCSEAKTARRAAAPRRRPDGGARAAARAAAARRLPHRRDQAPSIAATFGPAVGVTSLGMFSQRLGLGHPPRTADGHRHRRRHRGPTGGARRAASWPGRCCR